MTSNSPIPTGFSFSAIHAGLKAQPQDLDLALIHSRVPCQAAGVFTQNHFPGEPVKLARERLIGGQLQSLVINSRISNVGTGPAGMAMAKNICCQLSQHLHVEENLTCISSTGIIGRLYPEEKILNHLPQLVAEARESEEQFNKASRAIMTTDTVPKAFYAQVGNAKLSIMAKGAGMIAPNMATMLAFICTDAELPSARLQAILQRVVAKSFNCLSIDFDTSTSDSCFLLANGLAGPVDEAQFESALEDLCIRCTRALAMDGEGVDILLTCQIEEAADFSMAKAVASSIVNSPLVKTMITGADPNWGRLLMAIGKVDDPRLAGCAPSLAINDIPVMKNGRPLDLDLKQLSAGMKAAEVVLTANLHMGSQSLTYWGGNLSKEYVSINADYTT